STDVAARNALALGSAAHRTGRTTVRSCTYGSENGRCLGESRRGARRRADRLGERPQPLALFTDVLASRRIRSRVARSSGVRTAPAVRILGARSLVHAHGIAAVISLAHGTREAGRGRLDAIAP